jgi:hypothetical protein
MDEDVRERIRRRAHEIWEQEGRPEGRDDEFWRRAETEIRMETQSDAGAGETSVPPGSDHTPG